MFRLRTSGAIWRQPIQVKLPERTGPVVPLLEICGSLAVRFRFSQFFGCCKSKFIISILWDCMQVCASPACEETDPELRVWVPASSGTTSALQRGVRTCKMRDDLRFVREITGLSLRCQLCCYCAIIPGVGYLLATPRAHIRQVFRWEFLFLLVDNS